MIGFTLDAQVVDEDGDTTWVTVIAKLDVEADPPALDLRIVGDDNNILTVDPEEARVAMTHLIGQLLAWKYEQGEPDESGESAPA